MPQQAQTHPEKQPFAILYTDPSFTIPDVEIVHAADGDDAEQWFEDTYPTPTVTWVVETDNVDEAYETYQRESTFEE